jgi:branched-chain amino acid transport system permease protein
VIVRAVMLVAAAALIVGLPWIPPFDARADLVRLIVQAIILAQFALALDFSAGSAGIINFGFAAFVGFGGYVSAWCAGHLDLSPWFTMPIAFVATGILGALAGGLTLRLRGIYAAVGLWFFGLTLEGAAINLTAITGGSSGYLVSTLFETSSNTPYYYTGMALLLGTFAILRTIGRSSAGLAARAVEQNLDAARASGVSLVRSRIFNFVISCAFGGLFGAFYAHYYGVLTPDFLGTTQTIQILLPIYLGGRGALWGGVVTAFPLVFLASWLDSLFTDTPGLDLLVYSLLLMTSVAYMPQGLAGLVSSARRRVSRVLSRNPVGTRRSPRS